MAIVLEGFSFGVEPQPSGNITLEGFVFPVVPITFSLFKINDHYAHSFVSIEVLTCTIKDLNPNVSLRFADKTLTFTPGSLTATETDFAFGYDKEALFMDFTMNAEFAAGRIHTITKTNVPVFTN